MSEPTGPNDALPPGMPPFAEFAPQAPALRPVPFEDLEAYAGFWPRVGGMFRMVFTNPMELFDRVPVTEGLGSPWRFLLLLSIPGFLLTALIFFLVGMGIMLAALEQKKAPG